MFPDLQQYSETIVMRINYGQMIQILILETPFVFENNEFGKDDAVIIGANGVFAFGQIIWLL